MTTTIASPTVILIAGHWLGAWAWDEVLEHLKSDLPGAIAMTLPGLDVNDPWRATRTLDAQAEAILAVIAQHGNQPALLVAHSGANAPVSLVMDRHPELVRRVLWVDSGPVATGTAFAPDFPEELDELVLPPFPVLAQQASLEDLSAGMLERFRALAVPEPGPVLRQPIVLSNEARRKIHTTLVCCSIPSAQVLELAQTGHPRFAEVANFEHLHMIDLPTGHWPMWSIPRDLAKVLASETARSS
ncbi:alpha/beta fold hydrolase [Arthrobacter sp. A2-55]|uniref:alpha/beta fold hydrolase n=1 Tax=Arthrobacter sp. A2-55 TaxID=2897337 RepID=UPI0021CD2784|nr:alpha/beta hydrolase [Arthrobacter sp. A2-55]MCU6481825.1 alpha/beta hydrolase [Arthrobacter sp. A2-55]